MYTTTPKSSRRRQKDVIRSTYDSDSSDEESICGFSSDEESDNEEESDNVEENFAEGVINTKFEDRKDRLSEEANCSILQSIVEPNKSRFTKFCNSNPETFGTPNSPFRRKVQNRRQYLIALKEKDPIKFAKQCLKYGVLGRNTPQQPKVVAKEPSSEKSIRSDKEDKMDSICDKKSKFFTFLASMNLVIYVD